MMLFLASFAFSAEITFTFANGIVSGSSPSYYEFDIMAQADVAGTRIGDNQVYINYGTLGFGSSIAANGKITVEKGTLMQGDFGPPAPYYTIVNIIDNSPSRVAVTSEYNYGDSPEYGNEVSTTPTQLMHIKIEIADTNQTAALSFEQSLMAGQEYESDNNTVYNPVTAIDTDDSPLKHSASALGKDNGSSIPQKYALLPNFPNPFNPSTTLRFELPQYTAHLQLAVYDVLGRKVATLFSGSLKAGRFNYQWNGQNAAGIPVPTGVYFAVLKATHFNKTIKMMLIK